ncbi:MAG: response regulator [Treponema sp.]|nr:response regulator [Candidatus Treponema caballi]
MIDKVYPDSLRVLVADDSNAVRTLLEKSLDDWGYDVTVCSNGNDAWKLIKKGDYYHILILDWVMPGLTGPEICERIRSLKDNLYRYVLILTANDSTTDLISGLNSGADDYLVKPVSIPELKARLNVARRMFNYERSLLNKETDVRLSCYKTLTELAEVRDYETGMHLSRIASLSRRLAQEAGCDRDFCDNLELFAPMHDIGKVGIPDGILHLPRKLTPVEFEIMKTHAEIGYQILEDKDTFEFAAEIAYTHHEKWDGSGYPRGLKGEQIPLSGRIVGLVDVYDALRSVRPYKTAFKHDDSVEWIVKAAGKSFDPDLVDAFLHCENDLRDLFNMQYEKLEMPELVSQRGFIDDD